MKSPQRRVFLIMMIMAMFFVGTEFLFEIRAIHRGWRGFWIEGIHRMFKPQKSEQLNAHLGSHGDESYSFTRSPYVSKKREGPHRALRIVVVGTSHSEDLRFPKEDLWVNQMGDRLREIGKRVSMQSLSKTEMINASWSGLTLSSLYPRLEWVLKEYKPDAVIVYELSNSINQYCGMIRQGMAGVSSDGPLQDKELMMKNQRSYSLVTIIGLNPLIKGLFGKTVVYEHLKSTIGVQIVDLMAKSDRMGSQGEQWYVEELRKYLSLCQKYRTLLILSEFLSGVDEKLEDATMRQAIKECFRYNNLLTEKGWLNTLTQFNQVTREFSKQYGIRFISARSEVGCSSEYFRDFVHFTRKGHRVMGRAMADTFAKIFFQEKLAEEDRNEF